MARRVLLSREVEVGMHDVDKRAVLSGWGDESSTWRR